MCSTWCSFCGSQGDVLTVVDGDCLYVFYMVLMLWQPRRCSDCCGWGLFVCVLHGVHFVAVKEMF